MDRERDWDEGVPLVLFAVRETVQESLGFSPADLVFGHTVRGHLKVQKDAIIETKMTTKQNVLDTFTFSHLADAFIQSDLQLGST